MPKKVPIRKCVGCQERLEKRALIRLVRSPEGDYSIDLSGKKPGRGAYLCPKTSCLEKAIKNRGLERSFQTSIENEVIEILKKQVAEYDS